MDIYKILFIIIISFLVNNILKVILYNFLMQNNNFSYLPKYKIYMYTLKFIPIVNYIYFKNYNNYKENILKYPYIEILNSLIYTIIILKFNLTFTSILYCVLISILIILTYIDIKYKIVPDKVHIILLILSILNIIFYKDIDFVNIIYGSMIISFPLLLISILTKGFGGGDIKLYFFLGFLLGYKKILTSFMISIIAAGIFSILLLIKDKNNIKKLIPFVPFISIGIIISIIFENIF